MNKLQIFKLKTIIMTIDKNWLILGNFINLEQIQQQARVLLNDFSIFSTPFFYRYIRLYFIWICYDFVFSLRLLVKLQPGENTAKHKIFFTLK